MLAGKVHHQSDFRLSYFVGVDAAFADAILMNQQHNACRVLNRFVEEALQDMHHKLHRCVIVIQQQNAIEVRLLGPRARLRDHRNARGIIPLTPTAWCHRPRALAVQVRLVLMREGPAGPVAVSRHDPFVIPFALDRPARLPP